MKLKYIVSILLLLSHINLRSQNTNYYWYKNKKVQLKIKQGKKFILIDKNTLDIKFDYEKYSLKVIKEGEDNVHKNLIQNQNRRAESSYNWKICQDKLDRNTSYFSKREEIKYVSSYYEDPKGETFGLSHLFYVRLHKLQDLRILESMAKENMVEILGKNKFMPLWYTLACTKTSRGNALNLANLFFESGKFVASEPDFIIEDLLQCKNDTYFADQWNLLNSRQYGGIGGIDINFCEAAEITSGCSNTVIAVIDHGVELS